MRKSKVIKIDSQEITVRELTVRDFIQLIESIGADASRTNLGEQIATLLPKATDLNLDKAKDMAPSELKEIYDAFREVNEVFFETAQQLGLGDLVMTVKEAIMKDILELFADLSKQAIAKS